MLGSCSISFIKSYIIIYRDPYKCNLSTVVDCFDYNYMYINMYYGIIIWYHYFVTTERTWTWEWSYDTGKNRSIGGWYRERPRSHGNATPTAWPTQRTQTAGSGSKATTGTSCPDEPRGVNLGLGDWHFLMIN